MNPAKTALGIVARPAGAVANVLNRPTAFGRNRPLYGLNLLDALRGGTLEDALRDRIVLITGASSGIGATLAAKLGDAGGEVVLVARSRDKLEETAATVQIAGGTAHVYPCDLTDLAAIRELAQQVTADLGRVDILVNNAGRSIRRSLTLSYDRMHDYERTMQLNYFGPVQLMLALLPGMREGGSARSSTSHPSACSQGRPGSALTSPRRRHSTSSATPGKARPAPTTSASPASTCRSSGPR